MAEITSKQWVYKESQGINGLKVEEVTVPDVGERDVLVKLHAASLNYRDVMLAEGLYFMPANDNVVPCSDGAGEVISVGSKVTRFKKGQRVAATVFQNFVSGVFNLDGSMPELGARHDGTLRQYGIFTENGLVEIPPNLSYLEAATLPCAALTAWNCIFGAQPLQPGDTVVTQGTGGVSLFAVQFAVAAGAQVISTTSSESKAAKLKELGAHHGINYNEDKNWGQTVKKLSLNGRGADFVVEIGGSATLGQSIQAAAMDGTVGLIGARGETADLTDYNLAHNMACRIRRIMIGSRLQFEQMVKAITINNIKPVLDERVFTFDEAKEALQYLAEGKHIGKVVIEI